MKRMNTAIAIGTQSFEKIREAHSFYIDKNDPGVV